MTVKIHFNFKPYFFTPTALLAMFVMLVLSAPVFAQEREMQHAQLQAFSRQLEQMQIVIADDLKRSPQKGERYYFDYQRFQNDLKQVQQGLEDYLTPKRAQPRDPVEILGHYQREQTPQYAGNTGGHE